MKKYALFAGMSYYPSGGMGDHVGYFDAEEDAISYFNSNTAGYFGWDWAQIVETDTWSLVRELGE